MSKVKKKTIKQKVTIKGKFGKHHWWIDLPVMVLGHVALGADFMPLHAFYERNIVLLRGVVHWSLYRLLMVEVRIE